MATELTTRDVAAPAQCWSCGDMRAAHFCESCGKVQPPAPTDYFSYFGLPRKLNIDTAQLEREFYRLSRKLHPDLYARASEQEQEWSTERSSLLNDAYRTLRDPVARTEYLLKLEGVQLEEQSKAATDRARESGGEKKQVVPPELLEEVFELNMQLQELKLSKQMGEAADERVVRDLTAAKQGFEARLSGLDQRLQQTWAAWDERSGQRHEGDAESRKALEAMVEVLNTRSYIRNLVRDVNAALEA
ncbi:MAG TPA: Fe-S protein assembly co-chaperone HscB [Terriglobales bacterium]|nr:Fe-S protein assembly co-chaperone HscB [Terriglobales bacterium]